MRTIPSGVWTNNGVSDNPTTVSARPTTAPEAEAACTLSLVPIRSADRCTSPSFSTWTCATVARSTVGAGASTDTSGAAAFADKPTANATNLTLRFNTGYGVTVTS